MSDHASMTRDELIAIIGKASDWLANHAGKYDDQSSSECDQFAAALVEAGRLFAVQARLIRDAELRASDATIQRDRLIDKDERAALLARALDTETAADLHVSNKLPRRMRVLLSEASLKRIAPGWHVPYVQWHAATLKNEEGDPPYVDIPQHAMKVWLSELEPGDLRVDCICRLISAEDRKHFTCGVPGHEVLP